MIRFQRSVGAIATINGQLLGGAFYGAASWVTWPSSPEWWGFGIISILSGIAAFGMVIQALRGMTALYLRDRALSQFEAQAKTQKNADMASDDALRKAGVIDG